MNHVLLKKQYLQKLGLLEYCEKEIQDLLEKANLLGVDLLLYTKKC
jgi:hypothetical protein